MCVSSRPDINLPSSQGVETVSVHTIWLYIVVLNLFGCVITFFGICGKSWKTTTTTSSPYLNIISSRKNLNKTHWRKKRIMWSNVVMELFMKLVHVYPPVSSASLQSTTLCTWRSWHCWTSLKRSLCCTASVHSKLRTSTDKNPPGSTSSSQIRYPYISSINH